MSVMHPSDRCSVPGCSVRGVFYGVCPAHHVESQRMAASTQHELDGVIAEERAAIEAREKAQREKYADALKNRKDDGWDGYATRYGRKVFEDITAEVANCPDGNRNNTLFRAGARLGGLVSSGHLLESAVEEALVLAGMACGLDAADVKTTTRRAIREGKKRPWGPVEK